MNCWFCNNDTKIWRPQLNWWMCPHCEQYNGFTKNGDYARSIPEQYKISSNEIKNYCRPVNREETKTNEHGNSGLCEQCNRNESLKLSKLSDYVPRNERNYEYEIQRFKDSLEEIYPLCARCKATVKGVLSRQALWLARYKMLFFKGKPFSTIVDNKRYSEPVCRIVSTILGSMAAYDMELVLLPYGGLLFQFCAYWITWKSQRNSDLLLLCLWICVIVLLPFKDKTIPIDAGLPYSSWLFPLERVTHYRMVMLLVAIIGFVNIMPKSRKTELKNMSFKKIESPARYLTLPHYSETESSNRNFNDRLIVGNNVSNEITDQSAWANATRNYIAPPSLYTGARSTNRASTIFQSPSSQRVTNLKLSLPLSIDIGTDHGGTPEHKKATFVTDSLNDSLSTLGELSLSEERPRHVAKTPRIFETRTYNTKSSELFKKSAVKKQVLSPPKLKSVTQTSWVAGGYWQEGIDPPLSLSRSSSQSSGFGSVVSNFGASREPSVHEFDRCSIVSDATQSYRTSWQTCNNPLGLSYQPSLHHVAPFPEPNNQQFNYQTVKCASPNPFNLQSRDNNSTFRIDRHPPGRNINDANDAQSPSGIKLPSHAAATIVTNPVWLPALLCGSLVINIIVLCTTLLR